LSSSCLRKGGCGEARSYGLSELSDRPRAPVAEAGGTDESPAAVERAAYEKGYRAGQEAGYAFGEKKAALLLDRLRGILDELEGLRAAILAEVEPELVELALGIARKVVQAEVGTNRDVVVRVTRRALQEVSESGEIVVRVNPGDLEYLESKIPDLAQGRRRLRLEPDAEVGPGGCRVETAHGEVDARIEEQLEEIAKELREAAGSAGEGGE